MIFEAVDSLVMFEAVDKLPINILQKDRRYEYYFIVSSRTSRIVCRRVLLFNSFTTPRRVLVIYSKTIQTI
jgi:hypothetical protein